MTEFGKYLRKFRIDHGETMQDMAKSIGVSSSFLSLVETGKKPIPKNFINRIQTVYSFTPSQIAELKQSVVSSSKPIMNTTKVSPLEELLAGMSAWEIKELSRLVQVKGGEISEKTA